MDGLAPFEFLKTRLPSQALPRIQFLSKVQLEDRDREHLREVIRVTAKDIAGFALAEAMANRRDTTKVIGWPPKH